MRTIRYFLIIIFIVAPASCIKVKTLPDEPHIEYRSFTVFDTVDILNNEMKGGRLKFYFEDGDGDLGYVSPEISEEPDSINLFFTLYRKTNGVMNPAPDDDPLKPSGYRIPYMERQGQNKILKGTISVTFLYLFYSVNDTIRYDFYIKDRAGNLSNTASTSEIPVDSDSTYTEVK
jgi:hypothetical protein